MRGEIVLAGDALDAEPAIFPWREATVQGNGHGRDGERALDGGDIGALDPRGQRIERERRGECDECRLRTLAVGILFGAVAHEPFAGVAGRQPK